MRTYILLIGLFSSLQSDSQVYWEGIYAIKYTKKKSEFNRSEIKIWNAGDSLNKIQWTFNAFFKEEWIWKNSGYCIETDSNRVELFIVKHENSRPRTGKKIADKLYKLKPLYVITQVDGSLFIESKRARRADKLELIKF